MSMEFYTEMEVKARKPHRCHICGDEIPIGAMYSRESGKYDGEFFDRCTCNDCYTHRNEYCSEVDNEYDVWAISDYLQEEYCLKICSEEEREECDREVWHCPFLIAKQTERSE